tara:strand:+ start:239 stop:406 length:168 start_codon:yes stop_codon:yes gene_type:complete
MMDKKIDMIVISILFIVGVLNIFIANIEHYQDKDAVYSLLNGWFFIWMSFKAKGL